MITVTRENVIRNVPEEQLGKWIAEGYMPEGGLPEQPTADADLIEEENGSEEITPEPSHSEDELKDMTVAELRALAKDAGIAGSANMNKATLIAMILNH